MKIFFLLLFANFKISFDTFLFYEFKNLNYWILFSPNLVSSYSFKCFRIYFNGGYYFIKIKDASITDFKIYQGYIKFQNKGIELKIGKMVFIPGFVGILNPFYKQPILENISSYLDGEKGVLLGFINKSFSSTIFYVYKNSLKEYEIRSQFFIEKEKFRTGIFSVIERKPSIGLYGAYFGKIILKVQGFHQDSNIKFCFNLENQIKNMFISFWGYFCKYEEFFSVIAFPLFTKKILALEIKFPKKIFEIPYILIFYDVDNKIPFLIFDFKYMINNNVFFETGFITNKENKNFNFSIYGGAKFLFGL